MTTRIERFEKELQSRRTFLQGFLAKLLGATAVGSFGSALAYLYPAPEPPGDARVFIDDAGKAMTPEQIPEGSGTVGRLGKRPVLVLRLDGELLAFSAVCTHLGCVVAWDAGTQRILCPCHGGVFGPDGRRLAGPPPKPLPRIPVAVEEGVLVSPSAPAPAR